jgi:predicted nuclease of restriction endonuclease-like RecB superfamily
LRDAISGAVSVVHARERYGVAIDELTMTVDQDETARVRAEIRAARRATATFPKPGGSG